MNTYPQMKPTVTPSPSDEELGLLCRAIQQRMLERGLTLGTAESCTGGGVAAALTAVSGASGYFQGSLVAYQDRLKEQFLAVPAEVIRQYDVVSQPVVEQMVRGACALLGTHCALATTGYAGEGNGVIPSGTIWIGWGSALDVHSLCLTGNEGRAANTAHAVREVLRQFLGWLDADGRESAPLNEQIHI